MKALLAMVGVASLTERGRALLVDLLTKTTGTWIGTPPESK